MACEDDGISGIVDTLNIDSNYGGSIMSEAYSQIGGARVGESFWVAINVTWPLAKLTVTKEGLLLVVLWLKKFSFEWQTVLEIRTARGLFSGGIQIVHSKTDYPAFVLFWSPDIDSIRSNLEKFGYSVKN